MITNEDQKNNNPAAHVAKKVQVDAEDLAGATEDLLDALELLRHMRRTPFQEPGDRSLKILQGFVETALFVLTGHRPTDNDK